jgi:hypothetical protein
MATPRHDQLQKIIDSLNERERDLLQPVADDLAEIENKLDTIGKLPFIRYSKKDPTQQERTPASKLYKELQQSRLNAVKVILAALRSCPVEEEDELDKWLASKGQSGT